VQVQLPQLQVLDNQRITAAEKEEAHRVSHFRDTLKSFAFLGLASMRVANMGGGGLRPLYFCPCLSCLFSFVGGLRAAARFILL
jgi:hypothetical protein